MLGQNEVRKNFKKRKTESSFEDCLINKYLIATACDTVFTDLRMPTRSGSKRNADSSQVEDKDAKVSKPNEDIKNANNDLSEYERIRLENIKRNQEFLGNLGLDSVKPELSAPSSDKVSKRGVTVAKKKVFDVPVRRSSRVTSERLREELDQLKSKLAEGGAKDAKETEKLIEEKQAQYDLMVSQKQAQSYEIQLEAISSAPRSRLPRDPISAFAPTNLPEDDKGEDWAAPMLNLLRSQATAVNPKKAPASASKKSTSVDDSYIQALCSLSISEDDVAKLTEYRVTSTWIHPSEHKLICAAGDKVGNVGIWDVDSKTTGVGGVFKYKPHIEGVNKIFCWKNEPSKIYSCSYDGTLRFLDLQRNSFTLAMETPEDYADDIAFSDVCFQESVNNVVLFGRSNGTVALADLRVNSTLSKNKYEWVYGLHPGRVNSIAYHPLDGNLVISSGAKMDGYIAVNDLRKLPASSGSTWKPVLTIRHHSKSINAVACSPDGQFLASVSYDNTIRAYSNFTLNEKSVQSTKVFHGKSMIALPYSRITNYLIF